MDFDVEILFVFPARRVHYKYVTFPFFVAIFGIFHDAKRIKLKLVSGDAPHYISFPMKSGVFEVKALLETLTNALEVPKI